MEQLSRKNPNLFGGSDFFFYLCPQRLTQIGEDAYRYWRDYEEMLTLSRNPLFPVKKNLNGNVTGALGCWFGYGATQYQVVIEEK